MADICMLGVDVTLCFHWDEILLDMGCHGGMS